MTARKSKRPAVRRFRVFIIAFIAGAGAAFAALILFSLLIYFLKLPVEAADFLSLAAFGTGCLVSGFVAGAMKRKGGLSAGVIAAFLFLIPVALISWLLNGFEGQAALNKIVVAILCGAVGGVIGVNRDDGF